MVIAWLLQHEPSVVPIIGGSTRVQVRENVAAAELRLTPEQVARLDRARTSIDPDPSETEPAR